MGNGVRRLLAWVGAVAAMLTTWPRAGAAPDDLPPNTGLARFYPAQDDLPDGWALSGQDAGAVAPPTGPTTPPGCFFDSLFPSGGRLADGPGGSSVHVQALRSPDGLRAVRSWAERCANFTMLGGGGVTGRNQMGVQPVAAPVADALAYRTTGQGPFAGEELELAGTVRGVLVLVSRRGPSDDDNAAAAEVYRMTVEKITSWRG